MRMDARPVEAEILERFLACGDLQSANVQLVPANLRVVGVSPCPKLIVLPATLEVIAAVATPSS